MTPDRAAASGRGTEGERGIQPGSEIDLNGVRLATQLKGDEAQATMAAAAVASSSSSMNGDRG